MLGDGLLLSCCITFLWEGIVGLQLDLGKKKFIANKYSGWNQQKNPSNRRMGNLVCCNLETNPGWYLFSFSACKELKQYAFKCPLLQTHLLPLLVPALYSRTVTGDWRLKGRAVLFALGKCKNKCCSLGESLEWHNGKKPRGHVFLHHLPTHPVQRPLGFQWN